MNLKNKLLHQLLIIIILLFNTNLKGSEILQIGNNDAKIVVKVFSSLTCPHCANFHNNIYEKLKTEYIEKNYVKFEHHSFPLDLAALNAEIIIRCTNDRKKSFQLLTEIYKKQNKWAIGSDINIINDLIKKIGKNSGLLEKNMDECLSNAKLQDRILNERIEAQKKYKISSTPTIYINNKKYEGKHNFKSFKKALERIL